MRYSQKKLLAKRYMLMALRLDEDLSRYDLPADTYGTLKCARDRLLKLALHFSTEVAKERGQPAPAPINPQYLEDRRHVEA